MPEPGGIRPFIMNWNTVMMARTMDHHLKRLAHQTAEQFPEQPERQRKLQGCSAHWLRHLSASMQDRAGISFKNVLSNFRHENDNTTQQYVHAVDEVLRIFGRIETRQAKVLTEPTTTYHKARVRFDGRAKYQIERRCDTPVVLSDI